MRECSSDNFPSPLVQTVLEELVLSEDFWLGRLSGDLDLRFSDNLSLEDFSFSFFGGTEVSIGDFTIRGLDLPLPKSPKVALSSSGFCLMGKSGVISTSSEDPQTIDLDGDVSGTSSVDFVIVFEEIF